MREGRKEGGREGEGEREGEREDCGGRQGPDKDINENTHSYPS